MTAIRNALLLLAAVLTGLIAVATVACGSEQAVEVPATREATVSLPTATATATEPPVTFAQPEFVNNPDCALLSRAPLPLADVVITDGARSVKLVAEMARSSAEQSQGLMCRASVPGGAGMLFLWDTEHAGGFWMFNTYVPLDIIYFGGRSGAVALKQMTPCPRDGSEDDNTWRSRCGDESSAYRPGINYTTTLELPQGWLEEQGFDTADPAGIGVSLVARS